MRNLLGMVAEAQSVHGIRSMLRGWCRAQGYAKDVSELCIAHDDRTATEEAYDRSDMLAERAAIMQAWGAFLTA